MFVYIIYMMDLAKIYFHHKPFAPSWLETKYIMRLYTNICRGNLMMGQLLKPNANIHKHLKIQTSVFSSSSTTFPSIFKPTITPNPTAIAETLSQLLKQNPKLPHITQIHTQIITHSLSSKAHLITALICSYISSKNLNSARILFDRFPSPSPFTLLWNLMIKAYSKKPNSQESLYLFRRMLECSIPDKYTFTFVITACSHQPKPMFGKSIHTWVSKVGFENDIFVGNSLLNFYSIFGEMEEAQKVFNEMPQRDVVSWTSLISGYTKCGEIDRAIELFCKIPERSDISWVVMISGFVANERYTEALRYFNDMLSDDKVKPNEAVLVCVLSACAHLGALDQGKWIHVYIDRIGILKSSNISTALIDMYSKCGRIDCAERVFNDIPKRDVLTWTSMITGLSMHGLGKDALQIFYQMLAEGVKPDHITLLGVLNGCSHSGLVEEGCSIFNDMEHSWGVCPEIEHYGCLIDLLGRAGKLQRAFEIVKSMPLKPDIVVWRALLSACRIHGNVSLGEEIINHVEELESSVEGGGYVLLSNLYASFGRWDKVAKVRKEMNDRKVELNPGWSWIEIDGTVHEFLAADRLHPQITEIHEKLNQVLKRASIEGGYVANTKQALFDLSEEEKEQAVSWHSEKLAVAFGLMSTDPGTPIRIVKNLRICEDCHSAMKAISQVFSREIVVRDRSRFHTFIEGKCSCKDYW